MSFRSMYERPHHYNDPEPPVEPPEQKVDGALTCCECEEVIPGDEWYYEVDGNYYCESCMQDHRHVAPFSGEW